MDEPADVVNKHCSKLNEVILERPQYHVFLYLTIWPREAADLNAIVF